MGLSQQLDQLRADAAAFAKSTSTQLQGLRAESSDAVANLRGHVAALAHAGRGDRDGKSNGNRLINLNHFEPEVLSGKDGDPDKPWQKQVLNYCKAKGKGFRVALGWAEAQPETITNDDDLGTDRAPAETANEGLFEYLQTTTSGEALFLV